MNTNICKKKIEKKIETFEKKILCLENFEKKWKQESFEKKNIWKKYLK